MILLKFTVKLRKENVVHISLKVMIVRFFHINRLKTNKYKASSNYQ